MILADKIIRLRKKLPINKYKNHLNDDFVMGYFIHLYTDYLWFKYFILLHYHKPNGSIITLNKKKYGYYDKVRRTTESLIDAIEHFMRFP